MTKAIGPALPNIPWEDRPAGCAEPVWRYSANPIIERHAQPNFNSVFNSAAVSFGDGFAGVFRADNRAIQMNIYVGFSKNGIDWEISPDPVVFEADPSVTDPDEVTRPIYRYDPRVCKIGDRYYVTWCNGYHGPTIGVGYTYDFKKFYQLENAFLPYNRNGVLFPRKINGMYMMLSRPSDTGHTPFGDIYVSQSPDMEFWGRHRHLFGTSRTSGWQTTKVGAGPIPIETDEGWLLIYHGVITTCNGFVYRVGSALLDIDEPWKLLYRTEDYILGPEKIYELAGDVPNVTFPCAALCDAPTGRIAIYYGCADTVTGLAFTTVDTLVRYTKEHSLKY